MAYATQVRHGPLLTDAIPNSIIGLSYADATCLSNNALSCSNFRDLKLASTPTDSYSQKTSRASSPITGSMDPVTVVGFLVAVVQLIDVTSKVVTYFNDVKDAPKERAKLAREATGLLALFTDLRYRMEETASTDPWFSGLQSLGGEGGPLMEFKSAMEDIADKLAPPTRVVNLRRVLSWTLDKKEIGAILSKIERLKTLVGLALQKDHL